MTNCNPLLILIFITIYTVEVFSQCNNEIFLSVITSKDEETANNIYKMLNKGHDFSDLAKKYSIDKSSSKGGNIGKVCVEDLPVELKNKIGKLDINEYSTPIYNNINALWIIAYRTKSEHNIYTTNIDIISIPSNNIEKKIPVEKKRIGIFPFSNESTTFGIEKEIESLLANKLKHKYILINRSSLDMAIREQALSQTGLIDENTIIQTGKVLGFNIGISGTIVSYNSKSNKYEKQTHTCYHVRENIRRENRFNPRFNKHEQFEIHTFDGQPIRIAIIVEEVHIELKMRLQIINRDSAYNI